MKRYELIILIFIIISYFIVFFIFAGRTGPVWDEADYYLNSENQFKYIKLLFKNPGFALQQEVQNKFPRLFFTHPALGSLFLQFFNKLFRIFNIEYINFRIGNLFFLIIFLTGSILLIQNNFNSKVLLLFLVMNLLNPKFIFYFTVGGLEFIIISFTMIISALYLNGLSGKKNILFFIILVSLFFAVKLNSLYVIMLCLLTAAIYNRRKIKIILISSVIMFFVLFIFYPNLWHNTFDNLKNYFLFHIKHEQNYEYYFSKVYNKFTGPVPWHYALLHYATRLPGITVILNIAGTLFLLKKINQEKYFFILAIAWGQIIILSNPGSACYNGIRLFSNSVPFLILINAIFIDSILNKFKKNYFIYIFVIVNLILLIPMKKYSDNISSYYNSFVGGIKGAEKKGLQIDEWGENFNIEVIQYLNKNVHDGKRIFVFGNDPLTAYYLKKTGILKQSLKFNKEFRLDYSSDYDYYLVLNNKSLWTDKVFNLINNREKTEVITQQDGIPLACLIKL